MKAYACIIVNESIFSQEIKMDILAIRRIQELVAARGPMGLAEILAELAVTNVSSAVIDQVAQTRDLGLIVLKDGKYSISE